MVAVALDPGSGTKRVIGLQSALVAGAREISLRNSLPTETIPGNAVFF